MNTWLKAIVPIIALLGASTAEVQARVESPLWSHFQLDLQHERLEEGKAQHSHGVHNRHPRKHHVHHRPTIHTPDASGEWLRRQVGNDPGVKYNRAREWLHWGEYVDGPDLGTVGVLPNKVFVVIKVLGDHKVEGATSLDGKWIKVIIVDMDKVLGWRAPVYLTLGPGMLLW